MHIGLIADIHGDLAALERALKFFHDKGIDRIWCAGDLVDRGPDGDAVVARIRAEKILCVQGNHDGYARQNQAYLEQLPERSVHGAALLTEETLAFLDSLPHTLYFELAGRSLLLAHGTPWDLTQYVHARSKPALFRQVLHEARTDFVILGHTHQPMVIQVKRRGTIINPGSLYRNRSSSLYPELKGQTCAILGLPYGEVTHHDINTGAFRPAVRRKV